MDKRTKSFPAQFKIVDQAQGICEAVVSVFGIVDYQNDRVLPGAFTASLARKLPKVCWMHRWEEPVGKTLVAEEWLAGDARLPKPIREYGGLYVKGQFNLDTQRGREAFSDIAFGVVDEFSIGYFPTREQRQKDGVNNLIELDAFEWSPVLVGANPATALLAVKEATEMPETKAQYLGEYAEADAAWSAFQQLSDALCWSVIYPAASDTTLGKAERLATCDFCLAEFHAIAMRMLDALLPETTEQMAAASAAFKTIFKRTDAVPPAGTAEEQLTSLLADAEAFATRQTEISALRAREGRSLSRARKGQLARLATTFAALAEQAEPTPAILVEAAEALLTHYRERARRRVFCPPS